MLVISLVVLGLLLFVHYYILRPYLILHYYKKQGFKCYFFPIIGLIKLSKLAIEKHYDIQYFLKHLLVDYPGSKGMAVNIFDKICLIVTDTSAKKDFFVYKQKFYKKNPLILSILKIDEIKKDEENLLLAEGKSWRRIRRLVSNIFNYDFVFSTIPNIIKCTNIAFDRIHNLENVNLVHEFQTIAGNIILQSILGESFIESEYHGLSVPVALSEFTSDVVSESWSNPIHLIVGRKIYKGLSASYKKKVETRKDFLQNFMMKYIQEKFDQFKQNPNVKCKKLLDEMFKLILKKEENFTLDEVLSNIMILFLTGTETTGNLLAFIIVILEENLMQEIDENYKDIDNINYDIIKNLEYLNGVIKESLRVINPAGDIFYRQALKDHKLGDIFIKKGTNVSMGLSGNFYDPSIFKQPFEFIPERWIKGHELYDYAEEKDAYCYLPFSAGARNCIGQHLAIIETKIILVKFLRRFKFELKVKKPITWVHKFIVESKDPLIAKLTHKKNDLIKLL